MFYLVKYKQEPPALDMGPANNSKIDDYDRQMRVLDGFINNTPFDCFLFLFSDFAGGKRGLREDPTTG